MKNTIIVLVLTLILAVPLSAATTVKGKVGSTGERVWAFVPHGDGQTMITLTWTKKNADMFVALDCTVDGELVSFGLGAAAQERVQRIEAGTFGEACTIAVSSFYGSSSFELSVESETPEDLTRRAEALGDPEAAELLSELRLIPLSSGAIPGLTDSLERVRTIRSHPSKRIQKAELDNQKIEYGF
jgi:hypothetical protein